MCYSDVLKKSISRSKMSLSEISLRLQKLGLKTNKAYLSKLQNGKIPPAGDKLNDGLALILNLDPVELKSAAYREKIPKEVLENLLKDKSTA
ncbi:XRE family transcriptional regulator [Radiobacillus kanasensis]|uniref:XRE family transcriptional regulator n=1 Tax=Radiobacillus kanasensis TaxID=2844358 RepID=UPI001E59C372|nr:XRE family transcriptional regulator [Radiobacillus kanasensis]UFU00334.1 XRE family transcriptional regulator [Radiobacillus kanasensis]